MHVIKVTDQKGVSTQTPKLMVTESRSSAPVGGAASSASPSEQGTRLKAKSPSISQNATTQLCPGPVWALGINHADVKHHRYFLEQQPKKGKSDLIPVLSPMQLPLSQYQAFLAGYKWETPETQHMELLKQS